MFVVAQAYLLEPLLQLLLLTFRPDCCQRCCPAGENPERARATGEEREALLGGSGTGATAGSGGGGSSGSSVQKPPPRTGSRSLQTAVPTSNVSVDSVARGGRGAPRTARAVMQFCCAILCMLALVTVLAGVAAVLVLQIQAIAASLPVYSATLKRLVAQLRWRTNRLQLHARF